MYYRSLNAYLRETFGCKVYKLALSAAVFTMRFAAAVRMASSMLPAPRRDARRTRLHLLQRKR